MAKTALEQWDETAANNLDRGGVNIGEECNPSDVNNAQRELMAQMAKWLGDDTLASATTTNLGSVPGRYVAITGTTAITGFGTIKGGTIKFLKFADALTLTHNGTSLVLPGGADILTAAGDTAIFASEGSGNWRCLAYQRASGGTYTPAVVGATSSGTGTYSFRYGQYTRVQNLVTFWADMTWTAHTGTGLIEVTLPVPPSLSAAMPLTIIPNNLTLVASGYYVAAQTNPITARAQILQVPTAGGSIQAIAMDTAGTIRLTGTYFAAQ